MKRFVEGEDRLPELAPARESSSRQPPRKASRCTASRGGGNKKIRDQPHALEPTLSKEIELGPESVGRLSICENHRGNRASH